MINNYANNLWFKISGGSLFGRKFMMSFCVLSILFLSSLESVGQATITPSYIWDGAKDLANVKPKFTISPPFVTVNTEDLIISIATDPLGNVYTLSLGKGVSKRDAQGNLIKAGFIPASNLDNPLDIDIDESGIIYIADYFASGDPSDNGKIKVFDTAGNQLVTRTILTDFYRPIGLEVDDLKVYVAEYNDGNQGPERDKLSRVRIYDKNTKVNLANTSTVEAPFRISVDSQKNVYVSQAGNNNPQVLVFDPNLNNPVPLPNITSAGSVVIDHFDFIHVLEYAGRVDFEKFINYENLDASEILQLYNDINRGIDTNAFTIKIFDKARNLVKTISDNNSNEFNIEFPFDIAFGPCEQMYTNNINTVGSAELDFDLEIYNRTPSFDIEKPTIVSCPEDQNENLTNGSLILPDYRNLSSFIDNCDDDLTLVQSPAVGAIITKSTEVTITAKDDAGNFISCTFQVIIEDEVANPTFTCPIADTAPDLNLDLNCNYDAPSYENLITNLTNFENSPFFVQSENRSGNSLSVNIKIYDGEGGDFVGECNLVVDLLDVTPPQFTSCNIQDIFVELENGETYPVPDFISQLNATDNCDTNPVITQNIVSGTPISETTTIILIAADESGNFSNNCEVIINITEKQNPTFTCPNTNAAADLNLDESCDFNVPSYSNLITNLTNFENSPYFVQTENRNGNSLFVNIKIYDGNGGDFVGECDLVVGLIDNIAPQFTSCNLQDITIELENGETYPVPDFVSQLNATDNCDMNPVIIQSIDAGTPITDTTIVTLIATDEEGNISSNCEVGIIISEKSSPTFDCPDPNQTTVLALDESCDFEVPRYSDKITNFENFNNSPFFFQTEIRNGNSLSVNIEVYDGEGGDFIGECDFIVDLRDSMPPTVNCPKEIIVEYSTEKTYTVPDFSALYSSSDNCSTTLNYFQTPDVGTVITEDISASFRVGDESNNFITCNFNIKFIKETDLQIINCPGDQYFEVGENCEFIVPDYTSTITANDSDAIITQSIPAGTEINNALPITITASLDGQTASCEFQLIPKDSIYPEVICPGDQNETFNPENGFSLPNYTLQAQASDNCAVAKIEQIPEVGTVIFEDTEVTVRIEDVTGNSAICTFNVILAEEITGNTPPVANDDSYSTLQDETLTVPASSGVLSNDFDGEGDGLSAILISSVSSGTLSLNSDGSFIYEPNAGMFGTDSFTYVSNDGSENSEIATVRIDVVAVTGNTVTCKEAITLELNENGTASLGAETLFVTRPADLQFSVNQEIFTCDDLGENVVTLNYSNSEVQGSCEVLITINDATPPQVSIKDITVALNEFRFVRITPEMLDNGSSDNCEITMLSLDKENFGCKELGENVVTFTATDSSGNTTSATAIVTVTGNCELQPFPDVEYIFIYPNPTSGPFQFATPAGVTIQRVEAYDARGRMIMFKNFSEIDLQYAMDLFGVQQAVYILKLFTSEGINIIRVIIN